VGDIYIGCHGHKRKGREDCDIGDKDSPERRRPPPDPGTGPTIRLASASAADVTKLLKAKPLHGTVTSGAGRPDGPAGDGPIGARQ